MIEELIKAANNLCNSLDELSKNEIKFYNDISYKLEIINQGTLKMSNDLKNINSKKEGNNDSILLETMG